MVKFLVLAALVAIVAAGEVRFHDCGHGEVIKVDIAGCSGDICVMHKSAPVHLKASFTANQNTTKIEVKVTGAWNGLEVPIPGIETDGCKILQCPLVAGQKYNFEYTMNMPFILPTILLPTKSKVTLKAFGDHGLLACTIVNSKVIL